MRADNRSSYVSTVRPDVQCNAGRTKYKSANKRKQIENNTM